MYSIIPLQKKKGSSGALYPLYLKYKQYKDGKEVFQFFAEFFFQIHSSHFSIYQTATELLRIINADTSQENKKKKLTVFYVPTAKNHLQRAYYP